MTGNSAWRGYWEQSGWGRQAMHDLVLRFSGGALRGEGVDCIGRFTLEGTCDTQGTVVMIKQYLGRQHAMAKCCASGDMA